MNRATNYHFRGNIVVALRDICVVTESKPSSKPSHELTWLEVKKANFFRYGFLMRYKEGTFATNIKEINDFFDPVEWEQNNPRMLFKISECILRNYFSLTMNEEPFSLYFHEAVRSNFCNAIVSDMPKSGGRIPFEEITLWLEETITDQDNI